MTDLHADDQITEDLNRWLDGSNERPDEVFDAVYSELKKIASACLRRERGEHIHQTTSIVNEAFLRLAKVEDFRWKSRQHFFAFCARLIRRILVEEARRRNRRQRGGGVSTIQLSEVADEVPSSTYRDVLDIDRVLSELAEKNELRARIVELRFFVGMSLDEAADVLGVSRATVVRNWRLARAWLFLRLRAS